MVAHPFRTATDTADSNVTDGGITETLYDALQKRVPAAFGPTESMADFSFNAGSVPLAILSAATGYVYFYDAADTTTADDGLTCLVTGDGRRYKLADASAIAISAVLALQNSPPGSPTDGDAYVVGTVPTGAWVGHANDIALYTPRGWVFAQPQVGAALLNRQTGLNIQYSAAASWGAMATALDAADVPPEALEFPGGLSVEAQQNAPPGSPVTGEYYLVGTTATGGFAGHENDIAYYTSTSTWAFLAAYDGMTVFNKASDTTLTWFDATGDWRPQWPYQATCQGRLTLESGVPISTSDQTAKATLYFTPFRGNAISLYVNGGWALRTFTEKSLSLSGYTTGKPYDIFAYDNAGVVAIESLVWTNDTTRATALAYQDGIPVKSGDATRRYLGTIYTTATGQTEDSAAKRMVWNYWNRVERVMRKFDTTATWSYSTAAWRQARGDSSNQVEFVIGLSEDVVAVSLTMSFVSASSGVPIVGVGLDSTTVVSAFGTTATLQNINSNLTAFWRGFPGVGRHRLIWLEIEAGSVGATFYGGFAAGAQSGLLGSIMS